VIVVMKEEMNQCQQSSKLAQRIHATEVVVMDHVYLISEVYNNVYVTIMHTKQPVDTANAMKIKELL
jgi:hypothetical protein